MSCGARHGGANDFSRLGTMNTPLAVFITGPMARHHDVLSAVTDIGWSCRCVSIDHAGPELARSRPDVAIVAAASLAADAELRCLHAVQRVSPRTRSVFLAAESSEDLAISALHAGAHHYVKEPWTRAMLQAALISQLPDPAVPAPAPEALAGGERLVGRSGVMRELRQYLSRIAPTGSNVLITGETGTGKELAAELIHANSSRRGPLISLNTAAIPDALLENELFGHERGAFTGAVTSQPGKLLAAQGGTVFLDEIGEISQSIQAKLLRVIETRSIFRLGGIRPQQVDVRILAATNDDLSSAAASGRFRKDLYYRLNVVNVQMPPLRERREDIPMLIAHYLRRFNQELGRTIRGLSARAMDVLCGYHWPGNIRELRNVIEALLVNLAPEATGVVDVPPRVMRQLALAVGAPMSERERLLDALAATNWNKSRAASQLRCSRMTLYRKMQRYNVQQKIV
jgi:DNA-binding NtrC family response regulator